MPQQGGYGRGLAAIFPGAATGRFDNETARAGGAPPAGDPSEELLATIATTDSGIALIYRSLDALVEQFSLEDAAVVLEERQIGRQVFCAGRRPGPKSPPPTIWAASTACRRRSNRASRRSRR